MRVYISADMEGVSGVVHSAQTEPGAREYDRACALMIGEVNAAIEGALEGGATYVLVNDSHWDMRNLRLEDLHPAAELLSGSPKPFSMMQGLDSSFDAVFFVGYHAMAGTADATIDHTYSGSIYHVTVNGRAVGEIGLNALLAAYHRVPVALVTGDQQATAEASALIDGVGVVQVKEAHSRSAARCLPIAEARRRIRAGAQQALVHRPKPIRLDPPFTLQVEFMKSEQADMAALTPGAERTGARGVRFTGNDYLQVFRAWRVLYNLAGLG